MTRAAADRETMFRQLNRALVEGVPHNAALGLRTLDWAEGTVTLELPYKPELVGNPDTGVLHGGAVTALLDAACGMSVFLKMQRLRRIATLELRIDYLHPAALGRPLRADAECFRLTRHIAFVRAVAYQESPREPVAAAAGTFMLFEAGSALPGIVEQS